MFFVLLRLSFLMCCLAVVGALTALVSSVWALPLETFTSPLSITCGEGQRECVGTIRVGDALGGHTGVAIIKGREGEVSLRAGRTSGGVRIESEDVSDVTILFSWDGDSNPAVLSGAGLNCLDLSRQGAYAFVISKMSVEAECRDDALSSECPSFTVDSRVYDAGDPTGQRFLGSTVVRTSMEQSDLVVPFSNFVRAGPRGKASFTCVGAVTIALRFTGLRELELEVGAMHTNGAEGLQPLPTMAATPGAALTMVDAASTVSTPPLSASPGAEATTRSMPQAAAAVGPVALETVSPDAMAPVGVQPARSSPTAAAVSGAPKGSRRTKQVEEEAVYGQLL